MSQMAVLIIAFAAGIIGLITGYFITRLIVCSTQVSGVLYVNDLESEGPTVYATLSEDLNTYKNGQFKLFIIRRIKK